MSARTLASLVALGLAAVALRAEAQPGNLASVEYIAYPYSEGRELPDSAEPFESRVQNLTLSLGVPIPIKASDTLLFPSFTYDALYPTRRPSQDPEVDALHNPVLQLITVQKLSESWTGVAIVSAGLASDLKGDLTDDDVVYTAALIASYAFSDDFTLGGGVTYDRRTGDFQPLPLVQLNWHLTERLRLSGVIPADFRLVWRPMESISVGLRGVMKGNRYHLDEEAFNVSEAEVAYSVIQAGPVITYHINPFLHAEVTGGWTIQRRVEILLSDQTLDVSYLENSPFLSARIRFGPSGWRSDKEAMEAEQANALMAP